jgi:predicted N-acetyltransferase YhbS
MTSASIVVRPAVPEDAQAIWSLIHELAIFERAPEQHTVSVDELREHLKKPTFAAFVAEQDSEVRGLALAYEIYSTWKGPALYLEDIIVQESYRRNRIGSALFKKVLEYTLEKGYARLGWQVLNWNTPAIEFYKKYQAELDNEWITCRMFPDTIKSAVEAK